MFTPKQFAALNRFAFAQNKSNSLTLESVTTVSDIENIGGYLFTTLESIDVEKGIFRTFSVIHVGPRGGVKVFSTRRDVY